MIIALLGSSISSNRCNARGRGWQSVFLY